MLTKTRKSVDLKSWDCLVSMRPSTISGGKNTFVSEELIQKKKNDCQIIDKIGFFLWLPVKFQKHGGNASRCIVRPALKKKKYVALCWISSIAEISFEVLW